MVRQRGGELVSTINPDELGSISPREFYPDGFLENYVNPVPLVTYRGEGALFPGASGPALTFIRDPNSLFTPDPGSRLDANRAELAIHDGSPIDTSEPRNLEGLTGERQTTALVPNTAVGLLGNTKAWATNLFSTSPIAALFLGLGGLLIFNEFVLRQRGVGRGTARVGRAVAGVGTTAGSGAVATGKSGIDAVNDAVGGAVEAVEDIAK